jgi:hypothetical protein
VAALDFALAAARAPEVLNRFVRGAALGAVLALGAGAAADLPRHDLEARARAAHRLDRSPPALEAVVDRMLDSAGDDAVFLGHSNPLSPGLLAWRAHQRWPGRPSHVPAFAPPLTASAGEAAIAGRLEAMRRPGRRVVAALAGPSSPIWSGEYASDVRSDSITVERLATDPSVRLEADEYPAGIGVRLRIFRFADRAP